MIRERHADADSDRERDVGGYALPCNENRVAIRPVVVVIVDLFAAGEACL